MGIREPANPANLTFTAPTPLSKDAPSKLMARLPKLIMFKTGPDLQHLRPHMGTAGVRKTR